MSTFNNPATATVATTCPSCHGDFIEQLEDANEIGENDPRLFTPANFHESYNDDIDDAASGQQQQEYTNPAFQFLNTLFGMQNVTPAGPSSSPRRQQTQQQEQQQQGQSSSQTSNTNNGNNSNTSRTAISISFGGGTGGGTHFSYNTGGRNDANMDFSE